VFLEDSDHFLEPEVIDEMMCAELPDASWDPDLFLEWAEWSQGIPRAKYTALKRLLSNHNVQIPSMRRVQSRLQTLTKIKPLFIDCCFNNCVAFTKGYADATECPICKEKRYRSGRGVNAKRARKQFVYIPIIVKSAMIHGPCGEQRNIRSLSSIDYQNRQTFPLLIQPVQNLTKSWHPLHAQCEEFL
jgi:hypothetical protein